MGFTGLPVGAVGTTPQLSGPGLALIRTVPFSATSTVSVDGCFSSTYDNYRVIVNITSVSTTLDVSMRMRVSGADNSAANYGKGGWYVSLTSAYSVFDTNPGVTSTSWLICDDITTANTNALIVSDFYRPNAAAATYGVYDSIWIGAVTATWNGSLVHTTSTSFDGLSVYTSTGNISGTLYVYGYRKA